MSSYPDPPAADAGVASTVQPVTTHDPTSSNYDPLNSPIAASAAHHGLQALQAATAGPVSPPGQAQYAPMGTPVSTGFVTPGMSPGTAQPTVPLNHMHLHQAPKQTRLRRACDMCSKRKVKCDDNGPPCTPCRELNLTCTRDREMKRRGPPNKHAEAAKLAKRTRIEPNLPVSPQLAEAISSMGTVEGVPLDAELIAPIGVLKLLVDDFFTYIHPLVPFPHEPSFRQSFENREDRTSREYLALLSSMICCLVASFPRSARDHLKAQQSANLFPRSITMIERCRLVALEARGNRFSNKEDMTVYDAATSYFLGLAAGYTLQWKLCRRFMAETLTIIRELGYHKPKEAMQEFTATYAPQQLNKPTDYIKDEVGKRVFWVMLLGVRSMAQLGAPHGELVIPPPTPAEPYPDLPMEVDDEYIRADGIDSQPPGKVSFITGFNHAVRIYLTMNPLVSVELSYGIGSLEWFGQKTMIEECLQACKPITNDLPPDLQLGPLQPGPTDPILEVADFEYVPPKFPEGQPDNDVRNIISRDATKRRKLQFEIQKANVYVSQLATRSYYVEKYFNLRDAYTASKQQSGNQTNGTNGTQEGEDKVETDDIDAAMSAEREMIVENLLSVLASISQRSLEPNGASVINKIRQVASTLIAGPSERKGPLAQKNEDSLGQFMDILMRLEKGARSHLPGTQAGMTAEDEEEELQAWASLREYQLKFAAGGGFLNGP